jgi:hypothetical protein
MHQKIKAQAASATSMFDSNVNKAEGDLKELRYQALHNFMEELNTERLTLVFFLALTTPIQSYG